jgi:hypothetical protein
MDQSMSTWDDRPLPRWNSSSTREKEIVEKMSLLPSGSMKLNSSVHSSRHLHCASYFQPFFALQRHTHTSLHPFIHSFIIIVSLRPFSFPPNIVVVVAIAHFSLVVCVALLFSFTNRELLCNQTRLQHVTIDANEKERNEWTNKGEEEKTRTNRWMLVHDKFGSSIVFFSRIETHPRTQITKAQCQETRNLTSITS